jgi:glycosyltransferase involved in cell wall biosynthesis
MTRVVSRIERKTLKYVDVVFVENDWMRRWMETHLSSQQVVFAPPGVDETFFQPASESNRGDDYLLSVGRFGDPRKNVSLLFSAYARIREKIVDAPPLVLAGKTPPTDSAWEHAKSLGIEESIEFRENVSNEELAELYRQATLFLLSSNEEGLGLVILEAMASGIPVVSTDCGGPSTLIEDGDTGYLVPVKDDKALAERVARLLRTPDERERMGAKGRERVERFFSQEAAGRRFIETYQSLLEAE